MLKGFPNRAKGKIATQKQQTECNKAVKERSAEAVGTYSNQFGNR
jgi:hypothetical protein